MAVDTLAMESSASLSRRLIISMLALLGIVVVSGLLLLLNYWLSLAFFFISLMLVIGLALEGHQMRNLLLLLVACLFVTVLVSSLAQTFFAANPGLNPFGQSNSVTILLSSVLVGLIAAFVGVIIPFLLTVATATAAILRWHENEENVSFLQAFSHVLFTILGIFNFAVIVDGELKGRPRDIARLTYWGGPGWLMVLPGQVVALHKRGKITRAVGLGSTMLKRGERIKAVLSLAPKGGVQTIENVLTRDRVPLTITALHVAQLEPAAETKARLEQAVKDAKAALATARTSSVAEEIKQAHERLEAAKRQLDDIIAEEKANKLVGDEYDLCYESVAKRAATKAPDVWAGMKFSVAGTLKDAIMSCDFDDLFKLNQAGNASEEQSDMRRINEIEKDILEKAKGSGPGKGILLRAVDINEIKFPKIVEEKIISEAAALAEERIKLHEAKTRRETAETEAEIKRIEMFSKSEVIEAEAKSKLAAAEYEAQAIEKLARAKTRANGLLEDMRMKARVEYYKRVIETLEEHKLSDETVKAVLKSLAASQSLEDELRQLIDSTVHYIRGENPIRILAESTADEGRKQANGSSQH